MLDFDYMYFHNLSFVGSLGRGPKYLVDEYAVMDTRYWPEDDPAVAWISIVEIFIMTPLCYLWYVSETITILCMDP